MKVIDLKEETGLSESIRKYFRHPHTRPYQSDLANTLYDMLNSHKHIVVEAPTGLGKTSPVWAGVKAYAGRRFRLLWLTRTASQVRQVSHETGATPVYGRRLLCLHDVISKVDQRRFNQTCRATRLAGRCPYYPGRPKVVKATTVADLKNAGRKTMTCPYEIQLLSLSSSTALVATHKQLQLGWLLARWRTSRQRVVLVLDEGQHMLRESLMMTKDTVSLKTLRRAAAEAAKYGLGELSNKLKEAEECYYRAEGEVQVEDLLPSYEELLMAGEEVQERKLRENYAPASYLLSLADFKLSLAGGRPLLVREGGSVRLEALADPQELKRVYEGWNRTITVSATISAELLEALLGEEVVLLRAGWPYGDNLKVRMVSGLTTKYEARDRQMVEDIRWVIETAASGRKALIFLPSFDLLEEATAGVNILKEGKGMPQEDMERTVSEFLNSERPLVAVFGGRLSEGIDLPVSKVLLIGIPFAPPSVRTSRLIGRLSEIVGDRARARLFGIILPGLWSALQAAGRAVRGPEDRATVYLVDNRYRKLLPLLPRWFRERVEERTLRLEDLPIEMSGEGTR